jgi:hypothetical protein
MDTHSHDYRGSFADPHKHSDRHCHAHLLDIHAWANPHGYEDTNDYSYGYDHKYTNNNPYTYIYRFTNVYSFTYFHCYTGSGMWSNHY